MNSQYKSFLIVFSIVTALVFASNDVFSEKILNNVEKGTYIPSESVDIHNLRTLIIPSTKSDYAFFQSIGSVSTIVMGNFKADRKIITLIKDENSDGIVDLVAHWYPDEKKFSKEKNPGQYCPPEKFRKLKEEIVKGKYNSDNPSADTLQVLEELLMDSSSITKRKNGFRVAVMTNDKPVKERIVVYFSDNGINGKDLIFEHNFYYMGPNMVKPIVQWIVYAKDSRDKYVDELVKELYSKVKSHYKGN